MQLIFLLACNTPPDAPAPEVEQPASVTPAKAPVLAGSLLWIHESESDGHAHDGMATTWIRTGSEERVLWETDGRVFPGPADPQNRQALLVHTTEEPHAESLVLVDLSGEPRPQVVVPPMPMVRSPAWAPDGSFIVFQSNAENFGDIYRVARRGGEAARLTDVKQGVFEPFVGPDGRIAYVSSGDGDAELYVMGQRGEDPQRVTEARGEDMKPAWSSRGQLVWLARRGEVVQTFTQRADGSIGPFRTVDPGMQVAMEAVWSPDGERLAVTVQVSPTERVIDLLDPQGNLVKRLDRPGLDEFPAWSPDSRSLVFCSPGRDGQPDIFLVDRDGENLQIVVDKPGADWLPRWVGGPT